MSKSTTIQQTEAFKIDEDHPTLTYRAEDRILALPYHLVRFIELEPNETRILVGYDDHEVGIRGKHLGRLWRELCAFRLKEITINGGAAAKALGATAERCLVERIEIEIKEHGVEDS
jgi:hypothetical protein